jgi:hypothetical protein
MSYSKQDDQVTLTMSWEDYELVLKVFAMATVRAMTDKRPILSSLQVVRLLNRLNQGNPNFTPYRVGEKKS